MRSKVVKKVRLALNIYKLFFKKAGLIFWYSQTFAKCTLNYQMGIRNIIHLVNKKCDSLL